jgi:NitT/TauT family transport system substrate-binding protein
MNIYTFYTGSKKMKKYLLVFLVAVAIVITNGCVDKPEPEPLKVAVTTWVGYLPLFYAQQKGWLQKSNIEIIKMSTLTEGMMLFDSHKATVFGGTQYEFNMIADNHTKLAPLLFVDKSFGGDMLLSNKTIAELKKSHTIHTYLEVDSVNKLMLEDFLKKYKITLDQLKLYNKSQLYTENLKNDKTRDILVVTYHPFDMTLKKNGFTEILSTRNGMDIVVIDALFAEETVIHGRATQTQALVDNFTKAVDALESDPKEFYEVIRPYTVEYNNYNDFMIAINNIKWLNKQVDSELLERLKSYKIVQHD